MNIIKKLLGKSKESSDNNDSSSCIIIDEDPLFTFEEYRYPTLDLLKQRNDDKKQGIIPMYSILSSKEYQDTPFNLPCAMGLTITGELFIFDLARVPHLFIEGADGVCLETPFQCASIEKDEIEQLLKFFEGQRNYKSYYCLPFDMSTYVEPEVIDETEKKDNTDMTYYLDPLFADAAKFIVQQQNSSLLFLQHQFALGYHRTSRLMDQLYNAGIVGPDNGEKPRSVLISSEEELDKILMKYQISPNPIIYPFKCQTNLDKRSDHHDFLKE